MYKVDFVPGLPELTRDHSWPIAAAFVISVLAGITAGAVESKQLKVQIWEYDDDVLQFEHNKMRDRKMRSYVFWAVAVTLGIIYVVSTQR